MTEGGNILAAPVARVLVALGVRWFTTVDRLAAAGVSGFRWRAMMAAPLAPIRSGLRLLLKESRRTETPDLLLWRAAPVLLVTLMLAALAVMPLAPGAIGADLSVGVVFFTAMFALAMVAVFAAGWGPNSKYPLIAGYRFISPRILERQRLGMEHGQKARRKRLERFGIIGQRGGDERHGSCEQTRCIKTGKAFDSSLLNAKIKPRWAAPASGSACCVSATIPRFSASVHDRRRRLSEHSIDIIKCPPTP
jgi:hypothetical protein